MPVKPKSKTKQKTKAKAKPKVTEPIEATDEPAFMDEVAEAINDLPSTPPSDASEQLDLATMQIGRGNTHVAVKTLIEVVRDLL